MSSKSSFWRRVRAWHVAGILLLLAVGGLLGYGFWPVLTGQAQDGPADTEVDEAPSSRAAVRAVVAQRTAFPLRTEASGHLVPWKIAQLSAEADGRVVERLREEGDRVQKGDLLLRLDDREERIAVEEARADLLEAQAEYAVEAKQRRRQAPEDTTVLAQARMRYRQAQQAHAAGTLTRSELQEAKRRFNAARVLTGQQRNAVQAATTGLSAAEQALERAELNLERTRIRAPFSGRVANMEVDEGQRVGNGEVVCTLLEDRRMKVAVDVLEADVVRIREGATAFIHVPALGPADDPAAEVEGRVYAVNPQIDAESGTGRVTVAIPNPNGRLIAGLFANVRLETDRLQDRLVVPDDAVLVRQGRDLVFRLEEGRAQWTYVTVGARSGSFVEIEEGIQPGDSVAVAGHFALAHDAPVRVEAVRAVSVQ